MRSRAASPLQFDSAKSANKIESEIGGPARLEATVANGSGEGAQAPQDKAKHFCHSCGGVTVYLTPLEAREERRHGHDLEAFPLGGRPQDQAFRTIQAQPAVARG